MAKRKNGMPRSLPSDDRTSWGAYRGTRDEQEKKGAGIPKDFSRKTKKGN